MLVAKADDQRRLRGYISPTPRYNPKFSESGLKSAVNEYLVDRRRSLFRQSPHIFDYTGHVWIVIGLVRKPALRKGDG